MSDPKSAWNDAGSRLSGLGGLLRRQYATERSDENERQEVSEALKRLGEAVTDAFETVGRLARDPEVQAEAKEAGRSVGAALSATLSEVSRDLRGSFGGRDTGAGPGAPAGAAPDASAPDA